MMQAAGQGLEKIVAGSLRKVSPTEAPVFAWPLVCGSRVAERTKAVGFSESVLRIEVSDRGWKHELQELAPRYLAAINRYVAVGVREIEFLVANTQPATQAASKKSAGSLENESHRKRRFLRG